MGFLGVPVVAIDGSLVFAIWQMENGAFLDAIKGDWIVRTRNGFKFAGFGLPKPHRSNVLQSVMSKMRTKFALDNTCNVG